MSIRSFASTALLTVAAAGLLAVSPAWAAHGGGGGGHGGGGGGHGGGGGGGGGRGGGFGGRGGGFGGGFGGGYGRGYGGGYGRGYYGGYGGYGYGYPYYYGGGYYPQTYGYAEASPGYYDDGSSLATPDYSSSNPPASGYQSFYPPTTEANPATASTDALVRVRVPDPNATVWIQGVQTKQRGTERSFESPPLEPGRSYSYDVRAQWNDNGRPVEQTQHVRIHSGDRVTVDFTAPASGE